MEDRRHLGEDEPGDAAAVEGAARPRSRAECRNSGQPIGEDQWGGRRAESFDGGKKVRSRKRHILVDTEGLVVEARVHSARVPDQDSIRRLLEPAKYLHPHTRLPPVSTGVTQAPQARLAEQGRLPNNSVLMPMHEPGAEWTRKATAKQLPRIPRKERTRGDENRADRNSGLRCRMA
jgi:hypothetical protein